MSNLSIPKIADLYTDIQAAAQQDQLQYLLNQDPKPDWVKTHPFLKTYKYLPIDKIEYLLKRIFKAYKIEVTGQGQSFNGVWVTVRVHYQNPISGEWLFYDGIGASQLQTKQGSSPADLGNINNGAITMAFPIAKTLAVKDACDHFGRLFGSDLNRKDLAPHSMDVTLQEKADEERKRYQLLIEQATPEQREKINRKFQQGS
jgi:hypothetical protein